MPAPNPADLKEITLHDKVFELLLSESEIAQRIDLLAAAINKDYGDRCPTFLMVLNGAFMFGTELVKRFAGPCEVAFIRAKSYAGMSSTGQLQVEEHPALTVQGKDIILVEDIVDSGHTLAKLMPVLQKTNPASLQLASLLFKPEALKYDLDIAYYGFEIPDRFVVGYGLDYDQLGRNYPAIYTLKD